VNGDGVRDEREPTLDGVQVFVELNGNGTRDDGEQTTWTDANGEYALRGPDPQPNQPASVQGANTISPTAGVAQTMLSAAEGNPVFNLFFGSVTTTRAENWSITSLNVSFTLNGANAGTITLQPADVSDNGDLEALLADVTGKIASIGLAEEITAAITPDGRISFTTTDLGKQVTFGVAVSTQTRFETRNFSRPIGVFTNIIPPFTLQSIVTTSANLTLGGLGFGADAVNDQGGDSPFTVIEVPFAGWKPTTGETIVNGVPVGTRTVQFTAPGEIATAEGFGNVQLIALDIDAPHDVFEGDLVSVHATATPTGGRTLEDFSFQWVVLADNGQEIDAGTGFDFDFTPYDNGVYTVQMLVTYLGDAANPADDVLLYPATAEIEVFNAAPVVNAGADQTVDEGGSISLAGASFTDAGSNDTHTVVVRWGDGSEDTVVENWQAAGLTLADLTHSYADNGVYTVRVTVFDDDNDPEAEAQDGIAFDTLAVTVGNVAPVVAAVADQQINEGDSIVLGEVIEDGPQQLADRAAAQVNVPGVQFTDAGSNDTHTATVDWGDGSVPATLTFDQPGSGFINARHAYGNQGEYTVTIAVEDDDGGMSQTSFLVTVANLAPVTQPDNYTVDEDGVLTVAGPGVLGNDEDVAADTIAAQLVTGPVHGTLDLNSDGSFIYTPNANFNGADSFIYVALDEDQGVSEETVVQIIVTPVNDVPVIAEIGPQSVQENATLSVQIAGSDVDGDTLVFSLVDAPEGATIDAQTGQFEWTANAGVGTFAITVALSDGFVEAQTTFSIQVTEIPVTPSIQGEAAAQEEGDYTLLLSSGGGNVTRWEIDWGDGTQANIDGNPASVIHTWGVGAAQRTISAKAFKGDVEFAANTLTVDVAANYLSVTEVTQTATGFHVSFNRPFDWTKLNLYGSTTVGEGAADVTLRGPGTALVTGSLIIDEGNTGFTFLRTGGILAAGSYTLTLDSRSNAFVDVHGRLLDGDANGAPGGNYVRTLAVNTATLGADPASAPTVSIGEFMRGPGQPVDLLSIDLAEFPQDIGIPLALTNGQGITSIEFDIGYYNGKLKLGASLGAVREGLEVEYQDDVLNGVLHLRIHGLLGLELGTQREQLLTLLADVPADAPYGSKHLLDIRNVRYVRFEGDAVGIDDDGLHVVGYVGDTTSDHGYSALDLQRMQRVIVRADAGFSNYSLVDPRIIGDVSGDGLITALDMTLLQREILSAVRPELNVPLIPDIPTGIVPVDRGGPDPLVSLPSALSGKPGDVITVPVQLDTAAGLESAQMRLAYDSAALEVVDVRKGSLTGAFNVLRMEEPGVLIVDMAGMNALSGGAGSLVDVDFRVKDDAQPGMRLLDLQWARLNDGGLTLHPAPLTGADPTDAMVHVQAHAIAAASPTDARLVLAAQQPRSTSTAASNVNQASMPAIKFEMPSLKLPAAAAPLSQDATRPNWVKGFVSDLGQEQGQANPNEKIRLLSPLSKTMSKAAPKLGKL
jgi:hypothetical protein